MIRTPVMSRPNDILVDTKSHFLHIRPNLDALHVVVRMYVVETLPDADVLGKGLRSTFLWLPVSSIVGSHGFVNLLSFSFGLSARPDLDMAWC